MFSGFSGLLRGETPRCPCGRLRPALGCVSRWWDSVRYHVRVPGYRRRSLRLAAGTQAFPEASADRLRQMAIHREAVHLPAIMNQAQVEAAVIVRVFPGRNGEVLCARTVRRVHPLLAEAGLDAARKWWFQPMLRKGQPAGMQGDLTFRIHRQGRL